MFSLKQKKLLSLVLFLFGALLVCLMAIASGLQDLYGFQPDKAVLAWVTPLGLLIFGTYFCVRPLGFTGQRPMNRWYRAAERMGWILCELMGVLLIGAAVAVIIWETLAQHAAVAGVVVGVLVLVPAVVFLVGGLAVGGLAVTGYIAPGNEETRQWSCEWSQRGHHPRAGSAEEDPPSV